MGSDISRSCTSDDQPGAAEKKRVGRRGAEIDRRAPGAGSGDEAASDSEQRGGGNGGGVVERRRRKKKHARKLTMEGEIEEGELEDTQEGAGEINFNREYEQQSGGTGSTASPQKGPSEMEIGVLMLGDDEAYNESILGPGRTRNKGAKGIGVVSGIGEDLEEVDAEGLRALYAFKTASSADAERQDFEYELPDLAERLGASLKILTAGYDEAVMHVPHVRPTTSYRAYNLGPSAYGNEFSQGGGGGGLDDVTPIGTRRPSSFHTFYDEDQNFGHEYRPAPVPYTPGELLLQKAAMQRRLRKIKSELHWFKHKKEAKLEERDAARKKAEQQAERSLNSQSASNKKSRRQSLSMPNTPSGGMKRQGAFRSSLAMASGGNRSSLAMAAGGNRSSLAGNRSSLAGPGAVRRSVAAGGNQFN